MVKQIIGWSINTEDRAWLLRLFAPRYGRVIADHVTLRFNADAETSLPTERFGEIIGEADDGAGLQALVVMIGGATERGDGSHYHITWSLGQGRQAKDSNEVIKDIAWRTVDPAVGVALVPARWNG